MAVDVCDEDQSRVDNVAISVVAAELYKAIQTAPEVLIFISSSTDNFINLAKKGYEAYESSQQGQQGGQGTESYNRDRGLVLTKLTLKAMAKVAKVARVDKADKAGMDKVAREVMVEGKGAMIKAIKVKSVQIKAAKARGAIINLAKVADMANLTKEATEASCNQGEGQYGHSQPGGGGGGYGSHSGPDLDHDAVIQNASQHAGDSGDSSLFGNAMGFVKQNQSQHTQPIDEQNVQDAHTEAYQRGNASSLDAGSLGSAAAMQVLKQFTSGGSSGGGGNSQSQLISLAMAEASKLFDSQNNPSGQKQDAVNGAAMTIMKLLVQSKMGGAPATGGSDSGGLGSLMGLASQFMK
ncbi:hypothetical protein FRC10_004186 [Ceratobasidium sp. 414]|nr:hypothetical protein FRC10_004186 [Ceratobasidium sp. 414]